MRFDLFAFVNLILYGVLALNLYALIDKPSPSWMTILVVIVTLVIRRSGSERWI